MISKRAGALVFFVGMIASASVFEYFGVLSTSLMAQIP